MNPNRTLKGKKRLLAAGVIACASLAMAQAGAKHDGVISQDFEPFRSAFNAASGNVRAVLLVGPT